MKIDNAILLAPHNDDETLFASFLCLKHNPVVVICLYADDHRVAETKCAMEELGNVWMQWPFKADKPDWGAIQAQIRLMAEQYEHCFAPEPAFFANGHDKEKTTPAGWGVLQHDRIGQFALEAFGRERFTGYHTYTRWGGKVTEGTEVEFEPEWLLWKLRALACYRSQVLLPATMPHFAESLREYVA